MIVEFIKSIMKVLPENQSYCNKNHSMEQPMVSIRDVYGKNHLMVSLHDGPAKGTRALGHC